MTVRIRMTEDDAAQAELRPDDTVVFVFKASDWLYGRAWQASVIEGRLNRYQDDFHILRVNYLEPGRLIYTVRVTGSPTRLWTQAQIAELIISLNPRGFELAFLESMRDFGERIVEPTAQFALDVVTLGAIGVGLYLVATRAKPAAAPA